MGLLSSQKYDTILWDFCNWLGEDDCRINNIIKGKYQEVINDFLRQIDSKEWENNNPKKYDYDFSFFNKSHSNIKGDAYEKNDNGRDK